MLTHPEFIDLYIFARREIDRHDLTLNDARVAGVIVQNSFGEFLPSIELDHAIDLAWLTGLTKGKACETVQRLEKFRVIEVSQDRKIYTFMPPSAAWPWGYRERVTDVRLRELEGALRWKNKGPRQQELFGPDGAEEFRVALTLERMRDALLQHHRDAIARSDAMYQEPGAGAAPAFLPSMERLPRPAPLSSGEGLSRPADSVEPGVDAGSARYSQPPVAMQAAIRAPEVGMEMREGFPNREPLERQPVPESGTPHVNSKCFTDSMPSKAVKTDETLSALSGRFPIREPVDRGERGALGFLDVSAPEDEVMRWLREAMGAKAMAEWGGWWRLRFRETPREVLEACWGLKSRLANYSLPPVRNRGRWLNDEFYRCKRIAEMQPTVPDPGTNPERK